MGRPVTPIDIHEQQSLARIASLAASIMPTLRKLGRSRYDSERTLRGWLAEDGIRYSTGDLAPALDLLQSTGRIGRPTITATTSARGGWLPAQLAYRSGAPNGC